MISVNSIHLQWDTTRMNISVCEDIWEEDWETIRCYPEMTSAFKGLRLMILLCWILLHIFELKDLSHECILWALQDLDSDLSPSSLSSTRNRVQQALLTGGLPSLPCLQNLSETHGIAQGHNACLAFVRSWCDPQNTHAHTHNLRNPNNATHISVMQKWEWLYILWYVS